jgi:hypothetical protein
MLRRRLVRAAAWLAASGQVFAGVAAVAVARSAEASNLTPSVDGSCGANRNYTCVGSAFGECCSSNGFCGVGNSFCTTGCQESFGRCRSAVVSAAASSTCEAVTVTVMTIDYQTETVTAGEVEVTVFTISYDTVTETTIQALDTLTVEVVSISYDHDTVTETLPPRTVTVTPTFTSTVTRTSVSAWTTYTSSVTTTVSETKTSTVVTAVSVVSSAAPRPVRDEIDPNCTCILS